MQRESSVNKGNAVEILNRAFNHLWLDSEDTRPLGLEHIEMHAAMQRVKGREQGSTLIPVLALMTVFTVAAVLIAQSGLLRYVLARLAEVR